MKDCTHKDAQVRNGRGHTHIMRNIHNYLFKLEIVVFYEGKMETKSNNFDYTNEILVYKTHQNNMPVDSLWY